MSDAAPVPAPGGGREKRDINIRRVTIYGTALLLAVCLAGVGTTVIVFKKLTVEDERAPGSPFMQTQQVPPQPRLQSNPVLDLDKYRAAEEKLLHSYGWVDKTNGVVRIPIERALQITAQRGLRIRHDAPVEVPAAQGTGKRQERIKRSPAAGADRR